MPNVGRQVMADGGDVGGDTASFRGRKFWSGVFDAHDGAIREVHPYKRAKAADFHHSYYVSSHAQDAMRQGDAGFFWVDKDGKVNTLWRDDEAPKHIVDAIHGQIDREGMSDGGVPDDRNQVGLYSKAARTAAALPQKKARGDQMVAALRDPKRGVKKEELINAGLMTPDGAVHPDWAGRSVTTDELADHLRSQTPQVEEKIYAGDDPNSALKRYGQRTNLVLPNGENHREILLKLPMQALGGNRLFSTGHYPKDANVLAHIRMSDRTGPNGEKILHVEEIQSDWGQKGRDDGFGLAPEERQLFEKTQNRLRELKSREAQIIMDELQGGPINKQEKQTIYNERQRLERIYSALELRQDSSAPEGPYVQSTEGWTDLALKRVLKEAAENGYDKIVWTPGAEQGKRYDLTKHVGRINYEPFFESFEPNGEKISDGGRKLHEIEVFDPNGEKIFEHDGLDENGLKEHVGKELTKRIVEDAGEPMKDRPLREWRSLTGLNLKVGDEGMREYYDRIVPSRIQSLAKKHDPNAKVSSSVIKTHGDEWPFSAQIAHDGERYWVAGKSPDEEHANNVQLSPKFNSYEEADNHRNLLYSGYNQSVHSMDVTPQMRESIMRGQEAYARGGEVEREGLAGGGSPDNDMIRDALSRVASPFSDNPELAAKAVEIANQTYRVPLGTETEGPTYYGFKGKNPIPVSDVQSTIQPLPGVTPLERNPMSWEDFHKIGKGGTMINLGGDRSRLGLLTHINGKQLGWPVELHAGPEYMLEPNPGAVWANADQHTEAIRKKILRASEKGPVYGVYTPMGPKTVDSSFHMFDALMSQVSAEPLSEKAAAQVDDSLKKGKFVMGNRPEDIKNRERAIEHMSGWPGIGNPLEAREYAKKLPGSIRSLIVKHFDKDAFRKLGIPHVGHTRAAITNPDLLGASANMMGYRIAELSPEAVEQTAFKHGTYASPTGGTYKADVPLVQRHYAMPDVMDEFLSTRAGKGDIIMHPYSLQPGGRNAARKMLEDQKHMQPINQRMLDSIQQGLERQSKYGLKKGGAVQGYADGGAPEEIDTSYLANLWRGLQSIPEVAYNYLKDTPYEQMGSDAVDLGKHVYNDITENPIENLVTALPVVGSGKAAYDAYQINNRIQQAYKEGNHGDAKKLERALALSSLGAIPIFGELSSVGAGAARLVEDATLNGVTRAATRAATRAITNSLPQDAYQAAENMVSETLSDAVKAARKRMFVGETDAKKSDKSGKYAHGGHVEGYDNGGSVSDAILKYAESLPTAEESIETLKQFGRDVGEDAANLGKRIFSGFEKMADQGLERSPPPTVRVGEREVYVEPPPPPPKLYTLPDGRRASKAELDLANEMAHERFSEQHAMPPVVQENMPSLDRPAPTRAPMRERMERQSNVDRPVEPIASKTFKQAFNDARSRNEKTFSWTNPSTGKTMVYTTQLARKQGGRIPSFSQSNEWLADRNEPKIKANK